ncbi:hypothetical protein, partial [uncultured Alistipes sp.]
MLRPGKIELRPLPCPAFRIFSPTPARQNASRLAFALGFFGIFGFALDTPARQNASRLAFALGFFGIFD